jgi:ATP synthase subunit 6
MALQDHSGKSNPTEPATWTAAGDEFVLLDTVQPPARIELARERMLLSRLYLGLIRHEPCIARTVGRPIARRVTVPSLRDRPGVHPFTVTSHMTVTGVLALISFAIVLLVGFGKHGFHFFSLFVPSGTPALMIPLIFVVELMSFLVRPFSLGLRLFVAMTAGHILLKVLAAFVINGINLGAGYVAIVSLPSFVLMVGITLLELLVAAIQAYVFALLTSVYLNDAVNLH